MNVIICSTLKKKYSTKIKILPDWFMNVLSAEIWKKQERMTSGIIVFTNKTMETVRVMVEHSNLLLTKSALKIQHYKEEMTLNVPILKCVEVPKLLHSAILPKID